MECIYCDCEKTQVVETRSYAGCVFRKRVCKECKKKFYTKEECIEDFSELRECWNTSKMGYRDKKKANSY